MKNKKTNFLLTIILLVSFLIRIYKIDNLSLFGDEIDVGYQAYSLLKTQHDYRGYFLPFYTESLSESRAPLLIYSTIPSVAIFGLNEIGVRLPVIIFSILSIYFLYKLVLLVSESNTLALLSAMALSLTPWHYFYSRAAFEVTLLTTLILAATYYFYTYIKKDKIFFLYLSVVLFGLSFYTYNTANIFIPLLVLYLLFSSNFLKKQLNLKNLFLVITLTLVLISPMIKEILWGKATERFSSLNIFNNQNIVDQIIIKRTSFSSLNNQTIERLFHNKLINFSNTFLKNYFQSISPSFLFFNENQINPRHSISSNGLLFITFFILLIHGLFNFDKKNKYHRLFAYWLIISPIPAAMTLNGGTHPTRLFLMVVPLSFFIALSISKILKSKYYLIIITTIVVALVLEISIFSHEYFVHYPKDNPTIWNYGYKQLFTDLSKLNYNRLFISNSKYNSLLPYLFYNQVVPTSINLDDHEKQNIVENIPGFKISPSIFFLNNWRQNNEIFQKIDNFSALNDVFVLFQLNEIPGEMDFSKDSLKGYKTIKTIYNPDKTILGQVIQKI